MTKPTLTSSSVATKSPRSGQRVFFPLPIHTPRHSPRSLAELFHQLLKMAAAALVIFILIEGGARRRKQHDLAGLGDLRGTPYGCRHRAHVFIGDDLAQVFSN